MTQPDTPATLAAAQRGSVPLRLRRWLGRYWIVLQTTAVIVAIFTLLRLALTFTYVGFGQLSAGEWLRLLFTGLRFDVMIALLFQSTQILHMATHSTQRLLKPSSRFSIHAGLVATFAIVLTLAAAEFAFFDEIGSRFNYIAFEYLVYPTEVATNVWQSYPMPAIVAGVLALALLIYWPMRKSTTALLFVEMPARRRYGLALGCVALAGVLWLTTDMSSIRVSKNRVVNECAGNGIYSFVYYAWTNRFDYDDFYLTEDIADAYKRAAARINGPADQPHPGGPSPLERTVNSPLQRRDWNVVLILEESLGSDFIGALGDTRGLTPRIDALTKNCLLLDNFYATGNRTARAIEATLTGIPPIPTESILKRDHSENVQTLARVLEQRGYRRLFVYGGRGLFDGMRSFTMANGFERFVELSDYAKPTFTTAWGVCDEDVFDKAIEEFDALQTGGKPFFSVVLTVSNHRPFTYPDGRIDRPSSDLSRDNAVKYADHALGRFFDEARTHDFYKKTVFVIMGDHGARVYGAQMFPVKSYRVPVLIVRPDGVGAGKRSSTLASSLDIAPTIMGMLGGSYRSVFYGRDCLSLDPARGYALMQHNRDVALLDDAGRMLVLGCPKTVAMYQLDRETFSLKAQPVVDEELQKDTIAFYQTANRLYYDRHYVTSAPAPAAAESPTAQR